MVTSGFSSRGISRAEKPRHCLCKCGTKRKCDDDERPAGFARACHSAMRQNVSNRWARALACAPSGPTCRQLASQRLDAFLQLLASMSRVGARAHLRKRPSYVELSQVRCDPERYAGRLRVGHQPARDSVRSVRAEGGLVLTLIAMSVRR